MKKCKKAISIFLAAAITAVSVFAGTAAAYADETAGLIKSTVSAETAEEVSVPEAAATTTTTTTTITSVTTTTNTYGRYYDEETDAYYIEPYIYDPQQKTYYYDRGRVLINETLEIEAYCFDPESAKISIENEEIARISSIEIEGGSENERGTIYISIAGVNIGSTEITVTNYKGEYFTMPINVYSLMFSCSNYEVTSVSEPIDGIELLGLNGADVEFTAEEYDDMQFIKSMEVYYDDENDNPNLRIQLLYDIGGAEITANTSDGRTAKLQVSAVAAYEEESSSEPSSETISEPTAESPTTSITTVSSAAESAASASQISKTTTSSAAAKKAASSAQTTAAENKTTAQTGDANGDGTIDSKDASVILADYAKSLLGKKPELDLNIADINDDGIVDSKDATRILVYSAKKILGQNAVL